MNFSFSALDPQEKTFALWVLDGGTLVDLLYLCDLSSSYVYLIGHNFMLA